MDLALLFFLPLLGGYFVVNGLLLTRYQAAREETARVYYRAAVAGAALAAAGLVAHSVLKHQVPAYQALASGLDADLLAPLLDKLAEPGATPEVAAQRKLAAEARGMVAVACIWSFVLGLLTPLWNQVLLLPHRVWMTVLWLLRRAGWRLRKQPLSPLERWNRRAITDDLERLLYVAMVRAEPVQVSLDNNKVYVGVVTSIDPVGPAKHFTLQPMMSGGRNSVDRDVLYTSFYDRIIAEVQGGRADLREEVLQRFGLVVPLMRIVTVSGFDFEAYKRFALTRVAVKPRYRLDGNGLRHLIPPPAGAAPLTSTGLPPASP